MQWTVAGKVLSEQEALAKLEALRQDGPTGILLIGADGAVKSSVISKLWNGIKDIVPLHIYGGAGIDFANHQLVLNNPPDLSAVDHAYRHQLVTEFRADGAKNVVAIWVKYPNEPGWTGASGQVVDQALRDNSPTTDGIELLLEVEELPRGR